MRFLLKHCILLNPFSKFVYSEVKGFLAETSALKNAAQKDWKNLNYIFSE